MKSTLKLLATGLILFASATAFAFPADERPKSEDEGVYVGVQKTASDRGDAGEKAGEAYSLSEIPLGELRTPSGKESSEKREKEDKGDEIADKKEKRFVTPEKKGQIALKTEPGDGLVSLSWKVTGVRLTPEDPPLRFALFYGPESGRYDRKLEVGSATEHRLRELKNNQVYFVKVQGYTRDNAVSIFSSEERVIPRPAEELGSALERSFAGKTVTLQDRIETDPFERKLKQFGYDFFQNTLLTGAATDNLPVGEEYVIGPGDSLRIDMWGGVNTRAELEVDRNGEITIPRVGAVKVWGLTYGQAKEAVNRAVSRYFRGYELNVTLGRLRTIQVFVVGEVEAPGTYTVSSLGTVINALSLAGGASRNGSLRNIKLLKGGKVAQEIDLYDMFLSGDRSRDVRLVNGDTIFVPVIGPVVAVAGEVRRPAIYELKEKTTLGRILEMSGGITAAGYTGRIQVERFERNGARIVLDYEPKSKLDETLAAVEVRDRDMVKVFPVNKALRQVVALQGNVARPGEYQFRKGMRVADLIPGFDAILPDTFLDSAEITRLALPDYHREFLSVNLGKALAGDEKENIHLQEQDTVRVFVKGEKEENRAVAISGQVLNPGTYDYYPNMTVRDLVTAAGSPRSNAFLESAELTRIVVEGGRAKSARLDINLGKALVGDPAQNIPLQPNDVLIVRGIPDWLEATDRFVTLKGEVRFPGTYSITKGERLSSVIERAGGFTEKAYLRGAKFSRRSLRDIQQKRMDEVTARAEQDILKKQGELASIAASKEVLEATKISLEGLMKSLEKLKTAKAEGRVVIRLSSLDDFRNTPYDIELIGGDNLEIPQTPSVVNVMGQVYNPTTLIHMPRKSASYYLKKAGGPTRDAEEGDMYILKVDGTVVSKAESSAGIRWNEDGKLWSFGGFMSASLDPGDTLVVPQKLERIAWMREIKDITTILGQLAVTAGIVIAAGL